MIRLVNASGVTVASYEYDPYGKVISATGSMAAINPLRYRSYYYDSETGLYFLMSRYYDPAICRFINADSFASTGQGILGHNMFAYCGNNPIVRADMQGTDWAYTIYCTETEIIGGDEEDTVYQTKVVYRSTLFNALGKRFALLFPIKSATFEYTVTASSVILYDNKQSATEKLNITPVRNALAEEMYNVAKKGNEDALQDRTVAGISSELLLHHKAYKYGIFSKNAEESFVGGRGPIGYDKNGWVFEVFFSWLSWF